MSTVNGKNGRVIGASGGPRIASAPVGDVFGSISVNGHAVRRSMAASAILDRSNFGRMYGMSFRDPTTGLYRRSLNQALGYRDIVTIADFRAQYERGGIAERIVEALPKATWSGGCELVEDPDPDTTTNFEEAAAKLFKKYDLWNKIRRADIMCGLGRYSVLIIGARGNLENPLPDLSGKDAILYFTPVAEDYAKIDEFDNDIKSPRFGMPKYYQITFGTATDGTTGRTNTSGQGVTSRVHHTRVIHLAEDRLDNEVYGKPRLRAVFNLLDDLIKVHGGGAEASWKRMDPGMQIDVDAEADLTPDDEERMDEEVQDFIHGMTRVMRTRGTKVNLLSAPVAGFGPNVSSILQLISATTGIPVRILVGSERGELASTQDRKNWADRVMERRDTFATPAIVNLAGRLIEHGALPEVDNYETIWSEIQELDEREKAAVANSLASANSLQGSAEGKILTTSDEIRVNILGLEPTDETEIEIDEPQVEAPPDMTDSPGDAPDPGSNGDENPSTDKQVIQPGEKEKEKMNARAHASARTPARESSFSAPALGQLYTSAWSRAANGPDYSKIRTALSQGQVDVAAEEAVRPLNKADLITSPVSVQLIERMVQLSAEAEIAKVEAAGSWGKDGPAYKTMKLNLEDRRFRDEATTRAAFVAKSVNDETRRAVRTLINASLSAGVNHNRVATLIRQYMGLNERQMLAMVAFEQQLTEAKPNSTVEAGGGRVAVSVSSKGLSLAKAREALEAYRAILIRDRAKTISELEEVNAINTGQRVAWKQAAENGNLQPGQMIQWHDCGMSNVRPEHKAMNGKVTELGKPFTRPGGGSIYPGQDPGCRCGHSLYFGDVL